MAIDKGLIPGDPAFDDPLNQGDGLPIAEDPVGEATSTPMEDGSIVVDLAGGLGDDDDLGDLPFDANLAEHMDEDELLKIGRKVIEWMDADDRSRDDWKRTYMDGLELLGLKSEDRTVPWQGACGVFHPVLTEAVVRFQSQAIMEIFPASGPVKTKIIGKWTAEKEEQGKRVQEELNYFVVDKMTEFRPETETLLFYLALAGSAFRKTYFDKTLNRPTALFVAAEDFVVPYGASDLRTCPRYTHIIRTYLNDIRKETEVGFYREVELQKPLETPTEIQDKKDRIEGRTPQYGIDERYTLYECHCNWDLQDFADKKIEEETGEEITTGIELPYVVTVEKNSGRVLAIRRNWKEGDSLKRRCQHFVPYHYLPGLGFYGSGLIHLIGGIAKSATSILRQLVDAGTLNNLPGGLKTRGLRIKGDDTPIMPGEFRDVDVPSGSIRDNITFIPYKEPSEVLHGLLNDIIAEGRRLGAAPDLPINAMTQQAPVGTTLALLERSMKVMSAVQARLHASLKLDFELIAKCIAENLGPDYEYEVDDPEADRVTDFNQVSIIPVSDPNAASMAQRVVQWQAAFQMAQSNPTAFDMPELYKQGMTILGIPNINKIVKDAEDIKPMDPVSENMALLTSKPVKAFLWQDHEAHITTHLAAIHDPKIAAMVGQSPMAGALAAAASAHIAEHLAYAYRANIEKQLGVPLPPPDQPLPGDVEVQLSKVVADAAGRLLQKDQAEMEQRRIQQQQQDPVIQMQLAELEIKKQDIVRKAEKDRKDVALGAATILQRAEADKARIASQERIAGLNAGTKVGSDKLKTEDKNRDRAIDVAKELGDLAMRAETLRTQENIARMRPKGKAN